MSSCVLNGRKIQILSPPYLVLSLSLSLSTLSGSISLSLSLTSLALSLSLSYSLSSSVIDGLTPLPARSPIERLSCE